MGPTRVGSWDSAPLVIKQIKIFAGSMLSIMNIRQPAQSHRLICIERLIVLGLRSRRLQKICENLKKERGQITRCHLNPDFFY